MHQSDQWLTRVLHLFGVCVYLCVFMESQATGWCLVGCYMKDEYYVVLYFIFSQKLPSYD